MKIKMKIYSFHRSGDTYYVYSHKELSSEEKQSFERRSLLEILRDNEDIAFIIREHFYFQLKNAVYICKYDREKSMLAFELLINEEAFSFEWKVLGTDDEPIIKYAASQEEEWNYFDVCKWSETETSF